MLTKSLENSPITITLTKNLAWFLREQIQPGPNLDMGGPAQKLSELGQNLRGKINRALLRFTDEEELEEVELDLEENEAWIIDNVIKYDGEGNPGTELLVQLFRGMWGNEYGLPPKIVEDPYCFRLEFHFWFVFF